MAVETKMTLRLTRVINAEIEAVFHAWTDPEMMKQWSAPDGAEIPFVSVDLIVGGEYKITMNSAKGGTHTAFGTYQEIKQPTRLVYTWDWEEEEMRMGPTLVTVEFNALGEKTEVIITHELFPTEEIMEGHSEGWSSCLDRLVSIFD